MFPVESQRKQDKLSTLQFESEIKLTAISSKRWALSKLYLLSQLNYNERSRAQKLLPLYCYTTYSNSYIPRQW